LVTGGGASTGGAGLGATACGGGAGGGLGVGGAARFLPEFVGVPPRLSLSASDRDDVLSSPEREPRRLRLGFGVGTSSSSWTTILRPELKLLCRREDCFTPGSSSILNTFLPLRLDCLKLGPPDTGLCRGSQRSGRTCGTLDSPASFLASVLVRFASHAIAR
jgi:hypothetical protein